MVYFPYGGMTLIRKELPIVIILLFLVSTVTPMILANTNETSQIESYDEYLSHSYLARYNPTDDTHDDVGPVYQNQGPIISDLGPSYENRLLNINGSLMDSAWPMYCHDTRHTGRSPYSTVNATGVVKWRTAIFGPVYGGSAIDNDGVIYIGSFDLNAVYPNGTLKWKYNAGHAILCAPAIDENGRIYFGTVAGNGRLYAMNPNGTVKWTYPTGGDLDSSPVIGDDGTIYVGSGSNTIHAIYPNGTRKWVFNTNHVVLSSSCYWTRWLYLLRLP